MKPREKALGRAPLVLWILWILGFPGFLGFLGLLWLCRAESFPASFHSPGPSALGLPRRLNGGQGEGCGAPPYRESCGAG